MNSEQSGFNPMMRRVSYRCIESIDMGGRTIYQVERVEVGVELTPDTFTLEPSTASGRGT
jgi:hypothetical protein